MSTVSKKFDPAYPTLVYDELTGKPNGHYEGITVLDALAIKAMQAIIMHHVQQAGSYPALSKMSYDIAEAMYAEKMERQSKNKN